MQEIIISALVDELEKIAASTQAAGYMQLRRGTRPYRVQTLLEKENTEGFDGFTQNPDTELAPPAQLEADDGAEMDTPKTAKLSKERKSSRSDRALLAFSKSRPYVTDAIKAGVPTAVFGKLLVGEGARATRAARLLGIFGASAAVTNRALGDLAARKKQRRSS